MSSEQCNNCGGFEKLDVCVFCSTVVCEHCKLNHAPLCEELAKRKRRNQGPTVANTPVPQHRRGHEVPPTTGPDRHFAKNPALGAPYNLDNVAQEIADKATDGLYAYALKLAALAPPAIAPESDVNIGLMGIHDLLKAAEEETGK